MRLTLMLLVSFLLRADTVPFGFSAASAFDAGTALWRYTYKIDNLTRDKYLGSFDLLFSGNTGVPAYGPTRWALPPNWIGYPSNFYPDGLATWAMGANAIFPAPFASYIHPGESATFRLWTRHAPVSGQYRVIFVNAAHDQNWFLGGLTTIPNYDGTLPPENVVPEPRWLGAGVMVALGIKAFWRANRYCRSLGRIVRS